MKFLKSLTFLLIFLSLVVSSITTMSFAEVAIEGETEFVDLIQGVYVDKKYEDLPDKSVFKFENQKFKRYVDLVYDNDRKVIRFKPKRKGSVTIRLINKKDPDLIIKQIKVTVQKSNLDKVAKEVKMLLGEIEGIEIKVLNNRVVVDGYILLAKDMNRIARVLSTYEVSQVQSLVRLSPLTRKKITERIEAEIDNPNIYVTVINDFFMLEGSESYAGEKKRANDIAQAHVSDVLSKFAEGSDRGGVQIRALRKDPNPIINNIMEVRADAPAPNKMIQVVVHYVELSKSYSKGFDFSWAPTLSDGGQLTVSGENISSTNILTSLTATITNLLPKLNWAREHGHARVLDTMNVTTEEGKQGEVSSVKEIIRNVATALGGVEPRKATARISIVVTPSLDPVKRDSVKLEKLTINVGEITVASQAGDETAANTMTTNVTVRDRHSAAIGGLMRSTSSTAYNKRNPDAAQPLFRLGASKELARAQSQFVFFVTPIIKSNSSEGIEKIKKKFRLDK